MDARQATATTTAPVSPPATETTHQQDHILVRYGSVCSGIEAATVAWHPLGWEPAFFAEIEKFPRAVLAHHYPDVPLHGDFTTIGPDDYGPIDLLVGGTPCQTFSIAGLRKGLDDERGNLALEYLKLAARNRARWVVWENVPGILSSNSGKDFGSLLGGLVHFGYGFSYRVFNAQHFGIPQRRRRVFVVGYLGDWRPAAAVLFERQSLQRHPAPRPGGRPRTANPTDGGHPDTSQCPIVLSSGQANAELDYDLAPALNCNRDGAPIILVDGVLRRMMPVECERAQGFPDGYTAIPWRGKGVEQCPDGPRYKALGNSMAVPVMHWIGSRIAQVNALLSDFPDIPPVNQEGAIPALLSDFPDNPTDASQMGLF